MAARANENMEAAAPAPGGVRLKHGCKRSLLMIRSL